MTTVRKSGNTVAETKASVKTEFWTTFENLAHTKDNVNISDHKEREEVCFDTGS